MNNRTSRTSWYHKLSMIGILFSVFFILFECFIFFYKLIISTTHYITSSNDSSSLVCIFFFLTKRNQTVNIEICMKPKKWWTWHFAVIDRVSRFYQVSIVVVTSTLWISKDLEGLFFIWNFFIAFSLFLFLTHQNRSCWSSHPSCYSIKKMQTKVVSLFFACFEHFPILFSDFFTSSSERSMIVWWWKKNLRWRGGGEGSQHV